jgi:hypothetical protein
MLVPLPSSASKAQPLLSDAQRSLGATVFVDTLSTGTVYISENEEQLLTLNSAGVPMDGIPLTAGSSMSILPNFRGNIYAVANGGTASLRIMYGVLCAIAPAILGAA